MRRFSFRLCLLTLAAGAASAVLRHFELLYSFDADGLAKPWAPLTVVLALFVLAYAVLLFFLTRRAAGLQAPDGYPAAFAIRSPAHLAVQLLSCVVLLAAALLCFTGARSYGTFGEVTIKTEIGVLGILALISGICAIVLSVATYRQETRGGLAFCALAPVIFYCFLLTVLYKNRAADPVILDYVYELFAVCSALLAFFFGAGAACGRPRPKRTVFFSQLGLFFSLITLADGHTLWMTGICIFTALWLLLSGYSYTMHLQKPHPAPIENPADAAGAEEIQQEEDQDI